MAEYGEMSIGELRVLKREATAKLVELRETRKAVNAALNAKLEMQAAREKVAAMSDAERVAMAQVVSGAGGVESGEQFGDLR